MRIKFNNKKISVYEDDLKSIYQMADNIVALEVSKDDLSYVLGLAQGMADTIRMTVRVATYDRIGKKVGDYHTGTPNR